jgi:TolB protein
MATLAILEAGAASAAWPGRNGPIVFAGGDKLSANGLWEKKLSWRGMRHLSSDPTDAEPQSSPDGRWIVFARTVQVPLQQGGAVPARHIFRVRSDGADLAPVTEGPVFDRSPSFAPSGRRILFSRFISSSGEEKVPSDEDIFSIRLDGTGLRRITSGPSSDRDPVFSPNGRIIAFDRAGTMAGGRHIYTMRPDGSRVVDITSRLAAWCSQPDFSPSGNRIVFVRGYPGDQRTADLFTMRPDGRLRRRLTGTAGHPYGGFSNPSYSPDGRSVVAQHDTRFGFSKLRLVRVRDRSFGATIGGRGTALSPDARDPVWQAR